MPFTDDHAKLLALCKIKGVNWHLVAREAQRPDGLKLLWDGLTTETSHDAMNARDAIHKASAQLPELLDRAAADVEAAVDVDADLVSVLDENYPINLRLIFNLPPFLFVRGELTDADVVSIAVVGTRRSSEVGLRRGGRMARLLTDHDVTVVSGLARGVDTAAHTAALDAGGRTIAVIGTGIRRCYPTENRALADRIASNGAVVSQFWPDTPPATYTFPRRNVTMSGLAQGSVVIEASSTSGAKMQARMALEHGKKVFLLRSLVDEHEWARTYADTRGAIVVDDVDGVLQHLISSDRVHAADHRRAQLALEFG